MRERRQVASSPELHCRTRLGQAWRYVGLRNEEVVGSGA
jgi:hypothetical protein